MVRHLPARRPSRAPDPTRPSAMQPSSQRQRAGHAASAARLGRAAPRGRRRRAAGAARVRAPTGAPRRGRCASWCCRAPRGCWQARGTRPAGGRRARRPPCCRTRPRMCRPRTQRCRHGPRCGARHALPCRTGLLGVGRRTQAGGAGLAASDGRHGCPSEVSEPARVPAWTSKRCSILCLREGGGVWTRSRRRPGSGASGHHASRIGGYVG